ncbi:MAG: UDP-N-acetylmuramate dehydrogenase [Acidobacteriaceae bacterium]
MINIERDRLLAPLTTFDLGGSAAFYCEVFDEKNLVQAAEHARKQGLPVFILGGGSNLLVSDQGFSGMVIANKIKGFDINAETGAVEVSTGEIWDKVVEACVENDLAGLECLSGVPGSVGGAVVQNISAYGQMVSKAITKVRLIDLDTLKAEEWKAADCGFEYAGGSVFKRQSGKFALTKVWFKLAPRGKPAMTYADVINYFEKFHIKPSLFEVRQVVRRIRANKGHLIDQDFESYRSSGSFFKNPVIEQMHFDQIKSDLSQGSENDNWHWALPDGRVKVAAARLIEAAGFSKGYSSGNVGLSPKHVLVLINKGGGTADEISNLALRIKSEVDKRFGVFLKEEVQRLGAFNDQLTGSF